MENIGGQAVIEGVMMKSAKYWTVAVRDTEGNIHIKKQRLKKPLRITKLPLIRGVITLFHAIVIGIQALEYSASKAVEEDEKPIGKLGMAATIGFSFLLGIVLFIVIPLYAAKLLGMVMPAVDESSLLFNLVDGIVRVIIFFLYVILIGLWSEMRRVFQYHGAEHKVIHAYESENGLSVENARGFSTRHPRCGTSFLMIVMVISILVFSVIPQEWPFLYKFLSRLVLIPLIAGVSYEMLKFSAKMKENPIVSAFTAPGLVLQGLTTREPDDSQIQVAIKALEAALPKDGEPAGA
jgi:uncharacterized protein YqhQ